MADQVRTGGGGYNDLSQRKINLEPKVLPDNFLSESNNPFHSYKDSGLQYKQYPTESPRFNKNNEQSKGNISTAFGEVPVIGIVIGLAILVLAAR